MFTDKSSITDLITHLSSKYPSQIPITFTKNCHSTHYLDLTISLNYHTMMYHKIHHQVYQKPRASQIHVPTLLIKSSTPHFHRHLQNRDRLKTTTPSYTNCLLYDCNTRLPQRPYYRKFFSLVSIAQSQTTTTYQKYTPPQ